MQNLQYTAEYLMDKWEARRAVMNLMGKLSAAYVVHQEADIPAKFWSAGEDICLGVNTGWYDGRAAVLGYYEAIGVRNALTGKLIREKFKAKIGEKTDEEVYGMGTMDYKPLDTAVVEVAGDLKTAKGLWANRGSHSVLTPGGPMGLWEWGWFAVDFRCEAGQWRIWHMQYVNDILHPCGKKLTEGAPVYSEVPEFKPIEDFHLPAPNVPVQLRALYTPDRPLTPAPRMPEPYERFEDTFSYGIV